MGYSEVLIIALGLAMDAFAVSVANGITIKKIKIGDCLKFGVFFGVFQFIMPLIGWLLGNTVSEHISKFDHWIAFVLLAVIGGKMIYETFGHDEDNKTSLEWKNMTILAIATSIDAFAVGVSFAVMAVPVFSSSVIIGVVAFLLSFFGVIFGKKMGNKLKSGAEIFGGVILIIMGVKILIEHLLHIGGIA